MCRLHTQIRHNNHTILRESFSASNMRTPAIKLTEETFSMLPSDHITSSSFCGRNVHQNDEDERHAAEDCVVGEAVLFWPAKGRLTENDTKYLLRQMQEQIHSIVFRKRQKCAQACTYVYMYKCTCKEYVWLCERCMGEYDDVGWDKRKGQTPNKREHTSNALFSTMRARTRASPHCHGILHGISIISKIKYSIRLRVCSAASVCI